MIKNRNSSADQKFFRSIWEERPHYCVECGKILLHYSATYISHHLLKSIYPKLRHEAKNVDVLCYLCHQKWDFWKKKEMKIYSEERRERLIRMNYSR